MKGDTVMKEYLDKGDTSLLDFVAFISYTLESHTEGKFACRWLCLRKELVKHYRRIAKEKYVEWVSEEREKELSRQNAHAHTGD